MISRNRFHAVFISGAHSNTWMVDVHQFVPETSKHCRKPQTTLFRLIDSLYDSHIHTLHSQRHVKVWSGRRSTRTLTDPAHDDRTSFLAHTTDRTRCIRVVKLRRSCTFAVLPARPQNSCISPHTTDRQKFWCSGNGGRCLRRQSCRLLCPEIHSERTASRSRYHVDHTDGLLRI